MPLHAVLIRSHDAREQAIGRRAVGQDSDDTFRTSVCSSRSAVNSCVTNNTQPNVRLQLSEDTYVQVSYTPIGCWQLHQLCPPDYKRAFSSAGRALRLHRRCHRFDPGRAHGNNAEEITVRWSLLHFRVIYLCPPLSIAGQRSSLTGRYPHHGSGLGRQPIQNTGLGQ